MTNHPNRSRAAQRQKALDAFIARKADIDALLAELTAASIDQFGVDPEEVDWGHVGNLETILQRLADAADIL